MRVLIVEDEELMEAALTAGLRRAGMAVDIAREGTDGLWKAQTYEYDVIVLDRDLPGIHGDDICRRLVDSGSPTRILMLTASAGVRDLVEGFSMGADDYLGKPFDFAELVARVTALGRRTGRRTPPALRVGELCIDISRRSVDRGRTRIDLNPREFGVLRVLAEQPGRVVSAEELLDRVWDENIDPFTSIVRVTIAGLRRKLGEPGLIETLRGVGYRLVEEAA
jgi:DNA-binding response OmpR family regulator